LLRKDKRERKREREKRVSNGKETPKRIAAASPLSDASLTALGSLALETYYRVGEERRIEQRGRDGSGCKISWTKREQKK